MARDLVSRCLVSLNGQLLSSVVSFNVTVSDPKTPVSTLTKDRRDIGTTRGNPKFTAEMVVVLFAGRGEVDWNAKCLSGEYMLIGYAAENGERRQMVDAWIDEVGKPFTAEGELRVSIKWGALNDRAVG